MLVPNRGGWLPSWSRTHLQAVVDIRPGSVSQLWLGLWGSWLSRSLSAARPAVREQDIPGGYQICAVGAIGVDTRREVATGAVEPGGSKPERGLGISLWITQHLPLPGLVVTGLRAETGSICIREAVVVG